jgi:hypothetical protein
MATTVTKTALAALREQDNGQASGPASVELALSYLQKLFKKGWLECRLVTDNGVVPALPAATTHVLAV